MAYGGNEKYSRDGGVALLEREVNQEHETLPVWASDVQEWVGECATVSPLTRENYFVGRMNRLWLKRECEQETGSFKQRGAYTLMRHLYERGELGSVVTASAGNHAQGVARAAASFGVAAEIHVPSDTPQLKMDGIVRHGDQRTRVVACHDSFTLANEAAIGSARMDPDATYIPPYDNEHIIAGQGTVGLEVLAQAEAEGVELDRIFVPVGGGGLLAGVAEAVKRKNPNVHVIGVQLAGNDSAYNSFHAGKLRPSSNTTKLCDGTAVDEMGGLCFAKMMQYVDDVILVDGAQLGAAYHAELLRLEELARVCGDDVYGDLREPAGMLAEAGAAVYGEMYPGYVNENWVAVASGGNYDLARIDAFVETYQQSRVDTAASRVGHAAILNGATTREYVWPPNRHAA